MQYFEILLPLALILLLSKVLGILCRKIGLPQVVGMLLAGVLVGLLNYIPGQTVLTEFTETGLGFFAKIGVILIMFSAGLETDVKLIRKTGGAAAVITVMGVVLPMALGFIVACAFNGGFNDWSKSTVLGNLFYGVILTATSVSVTVATLKELGKLSSPIGTAIISAAIIDDIIGVVVLSLVVGISKGAGGDIWIVILKTVAYFVAVIVLGLLARFLFKKMEKKYPHNRRIPIFSYVLCFVFAYCAEKFFGVADITGAYFAGLMLAKTQETDYIDRKADINTYMIFGPVFFANIGLTTSFGNINGSTVLFGVCFIIAAILGKFLGCGFGAKICGFSWSDSAKAGVGMMVRAEVCLVCAQKGVENGLIDASIMPFILVLIIITSFAAPVLLKLLCKKDGETALKSDSVIPPTA
ncbi:MAG: cation:proton antiporter [Christensenellales bacterium]